MSRVSKSVVAATSILIVLAIAACAPAPTPSPIPTATPPATLTPTPAPTLTPTATPTPTPVPWTFDPDWWKETHVWYMGQPLAWLYDLWRPHAESEYYWEVLDKTGVTAVNWLDIRFYEDWEARLRGIVDRLHSRGIPVVGAISMITVWGGSTTEEEWRLAVEGEQPIEGPAELREALLRDPYGNLVEDNLGTEATWRIYSTLHPAWQEHLLSSIKQTIDAGVDGFIIDELAKGSLFHPDFTDYTVQGFRQYLLETYSAQELEEIGRTYDIENFENFDYADLVRSYLPPDMTRLMGEKEWELRWRIPLPLWEEYDRFRTEKNKEGMARLISEAKAYAKEQYGKEIPFSANLSVLKSPAALYVIDLLDYIEMEWHYYQLGYFPKARAFSSLKLAQYFGKRGNLLTSFGLTRQDIVERGKEKSVNLYKTMIADAYGGGGAFTVEEGMHGIEQELDALAPYYRFPVENHFLFENLRPVKGNISVLSLWETIDDYHGRAYRGLSNLLADSGYQFGVVFGAEDVRPAEPAPPYPLRLDDLVQYSVTIVPQLPDITQRHADLLLQYVENGGRLIVFATDEMLQELQWERGQSQSVRLLLDYLRAGEATVGGGKILRVGQIWGKEYHENLDQGLRLQLQQILSRENVEPEVKIPDNVRALSPFMYAGENRLVIHFVNYDYDPENDSTNPIQALELEVALGELPQEGLTVTFYSPEAPQGQELEATVQQSTLTLTLPEIEIWGVLVVRP